MLKKIAKDNINDVTLILTDHGYYVRYGLESTNYDDLEKALYAFTQCQRHALQAEGHFDDR